MNRLKIELVVLAVLVGVLLGRIPDTLALRSNTDYTLFNAFVDVQRELTHHYVEEPDAKKMIEGAIDGMIRSLDDPHTDYLTAEDLAEFDKHTRGTFSGIGAMIGERDGHLSIISPLEDSPAFKAGIQAGDMILEIDGKSADGKSANEAVKLITGPEGTSVKLKLRHNGGEEYEVSVMRQKINIQTVKGFRRDAEHHWDFLLDHEQKVGYVQLTQFAGTSSAELREAIDKLRRQDVQGLILDMRFNPGGLLSQAEEIADMFLSEGTIVSTEGRNSPKQITTAKADQEDCTFPMVVLVNEFSASASEIVSGALKDNQRAVILGTRSYGKGSVQQVRGLAGGSGAIKVTTAYYYLPSGRNLHRRPNAEVWGVDPSEGFYVPMTNEQIRKMSEIRQNSSVIQNNAADSTPLNIKPDWIRENRSDIQLAAAVETLQARLKDGQFKPVGGTNATLQSHVARRTELEQGRDRLLENMKKVEKELKELDEKIGRLETVPAQTKNDTKTEKTEEADTPKP